MWKDYMPLLKIKDTSMETFLDYINNKGVFLHKQIYDILISIYPNCDYEQIASVIRYDKGIRNVLYKYLSAFEEKYRAILFNYYDVIENIKNPENAKIENLNLVKKTNIDNSFLYEISYSKYFSLSSLIKTLFKMQLITLEENEDFKLIVYLRNKTMHHNLIITSYHRKINEVNYEIQKIESWIKLLYKYLPAGMNKNFEKAINRCNNIGTKENVPNLDFLCLGVMKNGLFIKK